MDWKDQPSQHLRFQMLCDICDLAGKTVHEIGAGAGHLYDYLQSRHIAAEYSGSDLSAQMVQAARKSHPDVTFEHRDILTDTAEQCYDVVMCSGLFHVKLDHDEAAWLTFVHDMVRRMYQMCRIGIAFNMMTDQVDFKADNLYYSNPAQMLAFCRDELSRCVTLRHDYQLYEYTIYVYRQPTA